MNVVLIALDTLRADHLGCYGYERNTTPNVDALAARSFVFERVQASAPWTAPALTSLMTSLYPDVHQVSTHPNPPRMSDNAVTLAEHLQRAGYATAAFTEGGYARGEFGLDQGFDTYDDEIEDKFDEATRDTGSPRLAEKLDLAVAWMERSRQSPFFLFFHTFEPHSPYCAPAELVRTFDPDYDAEAEREKLRLARRAWNREQTLTREAATTFAQHYYHCRLKEAGNIQRKTDLWERLTDEGYLHEEPETLSRVIDLYDAGVRSADAQVARLWNALEDLDLQDDTIVVIVSDHGEGLGEHERMEHGYVLFEELLHVPLILHVPGRGSWRVSDLVRTVDLLPTLLELLGLDAPVDTMQGKSLVRFLVGGPGITDYLVEPTAFSHSTMALDHDRRVHAVRTDRWRLIRDSEGRHQLFDLRVDPDEERDVAEAHPRVVARLTARLLEQAELDVALRRRIGGEAVRQEMDEELVRDLQELGYLDSPEDDD